MKKKKRVTRNIAWEIGVRRGRGPLPGGLVNFFVRLVFGWFWAFDSPATLSYFFFPGGFRRFGFWVLVFGPWFTPMAKRVHPKGGQLCAERSGDMSGYIQMDWRWYNLGTHCYKGTLVAEPLVFKGPYTPGWERTGSLVWNTCSVHDHKNCTEVLREPRKDMKHISKNTDMTKPRNFD